MDESESYNGWCNYETWVVNMWLNSNQILYSALAAIKNGDESLDDRAEQLEQLVRELYEFEPVGIVADFVNRAFARVCWVDIVSAE